MRAILMLEDGRSFLGQTDMRVLPKVGKVIFDTRVVGYQEALTDTANAGKILTFTYPLIGNYGVARKFNQSARVWPVAAIIKEKSAITSNWQAEECFSRWARKSNLPVIYGIDTRTLAVYLRQKGEMLGVVSSSVFKAGQLLKAIKEARDNCMHQNWLKKTSVKTIQHLGKRGARNKVVVLDLGVSQAILKELENLKLSIALVPFNTPTEKILKLKPKALVISNGPEVNGEHKDLALTLKGLLGKIPVLGISTGAHVLALSLGAKIKKMPIGHHGLNYPVKPVNSLKGNITTQGHSYAIDAKSLAKSKGTKVTAYNLNDNSVEEFENKKLKILGVQYYPLSPGFNQVHPVLKRFLKF
ncbi:MAG: carbamoyl phosphate synthase small subunit, partial [Candidatus Omnitrophota bacterium]